MLLFNPCPFLRFTCFGLAFRLPDDHRRYLWRARVQYDRSQSPFVPHGPWVTVSGNVFRMGDAEVNAVNATSSTDYVQILHNTIDYVGSNPFVNNAAHAITENPTW